MRKERPQAVVKAAHAPVRAPPAAVARVFAHYAPGVRRQLQALRAMIFEVAAETDGVGALEETLKWGQPSYLTTQSRSGSPIRIDHLKGEPGRFAMYFNCQTMLVDTFRERYPVDFEFGGNRCLRFDEHRRIPLSKLRECIRLALTYHRESKLQRPRARRKSR